VPAFDGLPAESAFPPWSLRIDPACGEVAAEAEAVGFAESEPMCGGRAGGCRRRIRSAASSPRHAVVVCEIQTLEPSQKSWPRVRSLARAQLCWLPPPQLHTRRRLMPDGLAIRRAVKASSRQEGEEKVAQVLLVVYASEIEHASEHGVLGVLEEDSRDFVGSIRNVDLDHRVSMDRVQNRVDAASRVLEARLPPVRPHVADRGMTCHGNGGVRECPRAAGLCSQGSRTERSEAQGNHRNAHPLRPSARAASARRRAKALQS